MTMMLWRRLLQDNQGKTMLHVAVEKGKDEVVECLLKAGAHLHVLDNCGMTPLMLSILSSDSVECKQSVENIVKLLSARDDKLDLPDTSGRTALHLASMIEDYSLRKKLIKILDEAGAPINVKDVNGDTPVDLGYRMSEHTLFD